MSQFFEKIVPDTSVLIDGYLSSALETGEIKTKEIIFSNAAISELEYQANKGLEKGILGIKEIQKIQKIAKEKEIKISFYGRRPTLEEIKLAKSGEIDYLIREVAKETNAVLLTSDNILYEICLAYNIKALLISKDKIIKKELTFEKWFKDKDVTSIHLKENCFVKRKRGGPGNWYLEILKEKLTGEDLQKLALEISEAARMREDGFIEIDRRSSTIVQLGDYRIVIVKPPVSDGWEITIVKPIKKLKLEDYDLPEKLLKRLKEKAEGILVSGRPGSGKSTFVQALAEWYNSLGRIVKTVESPRDLKVSEDITQYSKNYASSEEIHDLLLLSRPDYVVFDEVRDTPDFKIYKDLRLSGVGMIGVVHAERPIDAIQRFIYRIDIGIIPQVIDTVIFIEKGQVAKVYSINLVVKTPSGMFSEDLARPVVEVKDFYTDELLYEIYTYGEEIVVVPVKKATTHKKSPLENLAIKYIEEDIKNILGTNKVKIKISDTKGKKIDVYIPEKYRPKLIGKRGKKIEKLEKRYNVHISVKDYDELDLIERNEEIEYQLDIDSEYIYIYLDPKFAKKKVALYIDDNLITVFTANRKGIIKIEKNTEIGELITKAIEEGKDIKLIKA